MKVMRLLLVSVAFLGIMGLLMDRIPHTPYNLVWIVPCFIAMITGDES